MIEEKPIELLTPEECAELAAIGLGAEPGSARVFRGAALELRARIWQEIRPGRTEDSALSHARLGDLRNIAMNLERIAEAIERRSA